MKHGKGIQTWPEGDVYKGQWKRGKRTGYGIHIWPGIYIYISPIINLLWNIYIYIYHISAILLAVQLVVVFCLFETDINHSLPYSFQSSHLLDRWPLLRRVVYKR